LSGCAISRAGLEADGINTDVLRTAGVITYYAVPAGKGGPKGIFGAGRVKVKEARRYWWSGWIRDFRGKGPEPVGMSGCLGGRAPFGGNDGVLTLQRLVVFSA
jgi:hypothetical protein